MTQLLRVRHVTKHFGGIRALENVSIDVSKGQIVGLIGPNGSGKTTLINAISGFLKPDSGEIYFQDTPIHGIAPQQIARLGLSRTFQLTLNPTRMTVMENMLLGARDQVGETLLGLVSRPWRIKHQEKRNYERAMALLEEVNLVSHANSFAGSLSGGQKKLLALAQILMAQPQLILLDEPVAGVHPVLVETIVDTIRKLSEEGQNFLVIEHNMKAVRRLCDRLVVLDAGQVLAEGTPDEVLERQDVMQAYLGSTATG